MTGHAAMVRARTVDDNGAIIPEAQAILIHLHTLDTVNATAENDGRVYFNELQPGSYELIVAPPPRYSCVESALRRLRPKAAKRLTVTVKLSFRKCKFIE